MPTIDLACPSCAAPFKVDESFAGRRGTCKHCGAKITIPGMSSAVLRAAVVALDKATPQQMLAELARRQITAVLAYSDPGPSEPPAATAEGDLLEVQVDLKRLLYCMKTNDVEATHVGRMLEHLAQRIRYEQSTAAASVASGDHSELFELKGDWLGMSLADFKKKYRRELPSLGKSMPWCSDESPGKSIPALGAESWHAAAGIVTARVDLPSENASPTIAQVNTDSVIYQFLDGQLFQIEAYFATQGFHLILEALKRKYGTPHDESNSPRMVSWWNVSATIELKFGSIRPERPARLRFFHDDLFQQAVSRVPSSVHDV